MATEAMKSSGYDANEMCVAGAGGGEGMGAIEQTLQALDEQAGGSFQVVAVCGRNKALIQRLQDR